MEKALYVVSNTAQDSTPAEEGMIVKLRLLDDHFYDDVLFKGSLQELIETIENGKMLQITKFNGDKIFLNSRLIVDFVLS